jgi:putative restriction endonuclease
MELQLTLQKYLHAFSHLRRGATKYGQAPHKPILLLTIIELIEKGIVVENMFHVNSDLVGFFKENWQLLVPTLHQPDFTQPFFYLQNDKVMGDSFWFLEPLPGRQISVHIKSVSLLSSLCAYGFLAADLFSLLKEANTRLALQNQILNTYFSDSKINFKAKKNNGLGYLHDQILDVLNEPEAQYKHVSIHTEEDVFVRNGLFKKLVPKIYNNRCSFTGMQVVSTFNYNFIDACHIVPFSHSHNDKINNGIALCPNLHRAFDRGLVAIDEDYRIMVSEHVNEDINHPYGLKKLAGKKVLLPERKIHYPDPAGLVWHRERIFK